MVHDLSASNAGGTNGGFSMKPVRVTNEGVIPDTRGPGTGGIMSS